MKNIEVKISPIKRDYYTTNLNGLVRLNDTADTIDSIDTELSLKSVFGQRVQTQKGVSTAITGNARGFIQLGLPIINKILYASDLEVLRLILKMPKSVFTEIVNFSKGYNKVTGEITGDFTGYRPTDFLFYAEYFIDRINKFDIEQERINALRDEVHKQLYPVTCHPDSIGQIFNSEVEQVSKAYSYPLIGPYRFIPNEEQRMKNDIKWNVSTEFINRAFQSGNERFLVLFNTTKEILLNGFSDRVSVLPTDIRPKICDRFDPITGLYNNLMLKNKFLQDSILTNGSVEEVRLAYKNMVEAHNRLCFKTDEREPEKKSMFDKLKGKKGFIRAKVLSKRSDYSGRSVVVVNPTLKINQCGLPTDMIPKMYMHHHLKKVSDDKNELRKFIIEDDKKSYSERNREFSEEIKRLGIFDEVPVCINRAPSLHSLSYTAYNPVISKSKAVEVHPLISEGQNMDFDGDTAAENTPITEEGVYEVRNLLGTLHNLFKPANGQCVLVPRLDMLHGLWTLTKEYQETSNIVPGTYSDYDTLKDKILKQEINVKDKILCRSKVVFAGKALIWLLIPNTSYNDIPVITKKTIKSLVDKILTMKDIDLFAYIIDELVELGFKVATLYPPTITLFTNVDKEIIEKPMQDFHTSVENATVLYEAGFDEADSFNNMFSESFNKADGIIEKDLLKALGDDNGFKQMVTSGARGDISNLMQIYSHKGLIAGANGKTFRAVIENSFASQLTPLEHFIAAYGSRKGLMDKSIKPAETGYAERLMTHTTSSMVITCNDCGTTDTLEITKEDISRYLVDGEKNDSEVEAALTDILVGRYIVKDGSLLHVTKANVSDVVKNNIKFNLRSPLKCKNPCCSICYGTDLSIRGKAVVGTPIGFTAAQAIGEPGTQLTMKSFQKGGVAKKGQQVSEFDKIDALLKCESISDVNKRSTHPNYDPLAWASGKIECKPSSLNPNLKTVKIGSARKRLQVDKDALLKEEVVMGENICIQTGDFDITEIQRYRTSEEAAKYLALTCFMTYLKSASVNMKHFEVLARGMLLYLIYSNGGNKNIRVGSYYTAMELSKLTDLSNITLYDNKSNKLSNKEFDSRIVVRPLLKSVKEVPMLKNGCMSNILLENIGKGLRHAMLFQTKDNFSEPLPLLALGRKPSVGTYYPNYIKERLASELSEV